MSNLRYFGSAIVGTTIHGATEVDANDHVEPLQRIALDDMYNVGLHRVVSGCGHRGRECTETPWVP